MFISFDNVPGLLKCHSGDMFIPLICVFVDQFPLNELWICPLQWDRAKRMRLIRGY